MRGAVVFELPATLSGSRRSISFLASKPTPGGDGVLMTIGWKPAGAADKEYRICYRGTIKSQEWTEGKAELKTGESQVVLGFSFDCGEANNTAFDSVKIANLDLVRN